MNAKELLTKEHIGKRVTVQSIKHGTISSGIFQGVKISEWDGSEVFCFTDGIIGETPQGIFQFPVSGLSDEILLASEEV